MSITTNSKGDGDSNIRFLVSAVATMPVVASGSQSLAMSPQHPSLWDGSIGVLTRLDLCYNFGRGSHRITSNPALPAIL